MRQHASHSVVCDAPPARVYELISDSANWPTVLEPCEDVTVLERNEYGEHIQITARVNGTPMTWRSRRRFLPEVFGIQATIVEPMKLVAAMTTNWRVVEVNREQSLLLLEHDYDICADVTGQVDGVTTYAQAVEYIGRAIHANSTVELGNLTAALAREAPDTAVDRYARHSVVCDATADEVYAMVRDPRIWPDIFDACVGVSVVESDGTGELVRIEALQDGRRVSWDTRRRYVDEAHRIEYELPVPMPFVGRMSGQWRVVPLGADRCLLTVDRTWRMLPDVRGVRAEVTTVEQADAIVRTFVDDNARNEMRAIAAYVAGHRGEPISSFTTRVRLAHPADRVYALLADVALWPKMLAHCESLDLRYDDGGHQEFVMDVQTAAGTETFRSIRLCEPEALRISYFQPQPPPVLRHHRGTWRVRAVPGGCEVIADRTVVLDPDACTREFGTPDPVEHKQRVRRLLDGNSRATVEACGRWLEQPDGVGA